MRFLVLLFAVFLVSCATPKTAPKAFYGDVYAPGTVSIEEQEYVSRAGVYDEADRAIARKSAFARLMLEAKEAGYKSFSISEERYSKVLGTSFTVRGTLYKSSRTDNGIYPLDAIKRLLQDLPLVAPKPKPRKVVTAKRRAPVKKPVVKKEPQVETEDPLVIMAPEDITGSIGQRASISQNPAPAGLPMGDLTPLSNDSDFIRPGAVSNLPTGVILRRNR